MFNKILTWLALLLTGISLGAYWFFAGRLGISANGSDWANFGSYVGGIFSGLAFLILIYQNYQREIEQKQQSENQRKQDFERTFFMMLEHHNNKLRFLEDKNSGVEKNGDKLSFVDYIYQVIIEKQGDFLSIRKMMNEGLYREYSELNAYFLNLFRILKFIYKNKFFNENNEYSSLLRSFISKKMLTILAYHLCGRDYTYNDYIVYINKFRFFEYMDIQNFEIDFLKKELGSSRVFKELSVEHKLKKINSRFNADNYFSIKMCFTIHNKEHNELKNDYWEKMTIHLVCCKRHCRPLIKSIFLPHYKIKNYIQVHLFIYFISTFEQAFDGNIEYKYIKNIYKEFTTELNNSPLIENRR